MYNGAVTETSVVVINLECPIGVLCSGHNNIVTDQLVCRGLEDVDEGLSVEVINLRFNDSADWLLPWQHALDNRDNVVAPSLYLKSDNVLSVQVLTW